jgi:hypothetical protein
MTDFAKFNKVLLEHATFDETTFDAPAVLVYGMMKEATTREFRDDVDYAYNDIADLIVKFLEHAFPEVVGAEGETMVADLPFLEVWVHKTSGTMTFKRVETDRTTKKFVHPKEKFSGALALAVSQVVKGFHQFYDDADENLEIFQVPQA